LRVNLPRRKVLLDLQRKSRKKTIAFELKRRRCPSAGKEWEELPPFTEESIIVGIAAHEVRHRVQKEFQIEMIKPEDAENTSDPELKALIRFLAKVFEKYPPDLPSPKLVEEEFDATVIEWMIAKLWHEGERDILKLATIVKEDWEKIKKERNLSFLFISSFLLFFLIACEPFQQLFFFLLFCIPPTLSVCFLMSFWWLITGGTKLSYSVENTISFYCLCMPFIVAITLPICLFIFISHSYHHLLKM
jgi:hypothetical protein